MGIRLGRSVVPKAQRRKALTRGVDVKVLVKTSFRSDLLGRNIEFVGKDFGKSGVDLLFLRRKSRHGI
ncbi:MAG: hypothetical protein BHW60_08825 [Sutterella sp. 54_7]|nr:MAG: hypothetical protein BHW60_08825 [Sutterella sp. 54_7]